MIKALLVDADSFSLGHILPEIKRAVFEDGIQIISASGTEFGDEQGKLINDGMHN